MTVSRRFSLSLVVVAALLAVLALLLHSRKPLAKAPDAVSPAARPSVAVDEKPAIGPPAATISATPSAPAATVAKTEPAAILLAPAATPSQPASAASSAASTGEVAATRRMYGAHAPLRTQAVANPDSEQNRQILQTMVTKALVRASESEQQPATTAK